MLKSIETLSNLISTLEVDTSVKESLSSVVETLTSASNELSTNLRNTTNKFNDAVKTRDKAKERFRKVTETIGLRDDFDDQDLAHLVAKVNGQPKDDERVKDLAEKLDRTKSTYEAQLKEAQETTASLTSRLKDMAFRSEVQNILMADKELPASAHRYVEIDLRSNPFTIDDETGGVVYLDKEGNNKLNAKGSPYTPKEFYEDLRDRGQFDALRGLPIAGSGKKTSSTSTLNDPNATAQDHFAAYLRTKRLGG